MERVGHCRWDHGVVSGVFSRGRGGGGPRPEQVGVYRQKHGDVSSSGVVPASRYDHIDTTRAIGEKNGSRYRRFGATVWNWRVGWSTRN